MNTNDGRIAKITVSKTGADLQESAPNAPPTPVAPPAANFDLVLEMEAGGSVGGNYKLFITAFDYTAGVHNAGLDPPPGPLNGPGTFAVAPWFINAASQDWQFDQTVTIPVQPPGALTGHVIRYMAALVSDNFQIVDIKQSEPFVLL